MWTKVHSKIMETILTKEILDNFSARWCKARCSVLISYMKENNITNSTDEVKLSIQNEEEILNLIADSNCLDDSVQKDKILKSIFSFSRALALSFSKFYKISFEVNDFKELFQSSQIPCFRGECAKTNCAVTLERSGCSSCVKLKAFTCDYWREAADGVVVGLGEHERIVRHGSVRHNDAHCLDVIFSDAQKNESLNWGKIPEHLVDELEKIKVDFEEKMKTKVVIRGINEGTLHYELQIESENACGGGSLINYTFISKVKNIYPGLKFKDVSPQAVLGKDA